jgi:hypothetical protein
MNAIDEMRDLKANPLPDAEIKNPLSYVWDLDAQIATITETLAELTRLRTETLDYAIRNNVREDERCRVTEKIRKSRTLNVDRFREVFPEEYMEICHDIRRDLEREIEKIGDKIPLTKADAKIKPAALAAAQGVVTVKENITYGVERK